MPADACREDRSGIPEPRPALHFDWDFVIRPMAGEHVSGDAALVVEHPDGAFVAVVDGLGHGSNAAFVARQAREFLVTAASPDVVAVLRGLHEYLRGSIGAVAAVAFITAESGDVRYAGIGNITGRLFGSSQTRFMSQPGIVGQRARTVQEQLGRVCAGDVLVMHTDGVSERFELADHPRLIGNAAADSARTIVRRFWKDHDDAACVVVNVLS